MCLSFKKIYIFIYYINVNQRLKTKYMYDCMYMDGPSMNGSGSIEYNLTEPTKQLLQLQGFNSANCQEKSNLSGDNFDEQRGQGEAYV